MIQHQTDRNRAFDLLIRESVSVNLPPVDSHPVIPVAVVIGGGGWLDAEEVHDNHESCASQERTDKKAVTGGPTTNAAPAFSGI